MRSQRRRDSSRGSSVDVNERPEAFFLLLQALQGIVLVRYGCCHTELRALDLLPCAYKGTLEDLDPEPDMEKHDHLLCSHVHHLRHAGGLHLHPHPLGPLPGSERGERHEAGSVFPPPEALIQILRPHQDRPSDEQDDKRPLHDRRGRPSLSGRRADLSCHPHWRLRGHVHLQRPNGADLNHPDAGAHHLGRDFRPQAEEGVPRGALPRG